MRGPSGSISMPSLTRCSDREAKSARRDACPRSQARATERIQSNNLRLSFQQLLEAFSDRLVLTPPNEDSTKLPRYFHDGLAIAPWPCRAVCTPSRCVRGIRGHVEVTLLSLTGSHKVPVVIARRPNRQAKRRSRRSTADATRTKSLCPNLALRDLHAKP